jgi:hypothetical protein
MTEESRGTVDRCWFALDHGGKGSSRKSGSGRGRTRNNADAGWLTVDDGRCAVDHAGRSSSGKSRSGRGRTRNNADGGWLAVDDGRCAVDHAGRSSSGKSRSGGGRTRRDVDTSGPRAPDTTDARLSPLGMIMLARSGRGGRGLVPGARLGVQTVNCCHF